MNIQFYTSCICFAGILFVRESSIICSWSISYFKHIIVISAAKKSICFSAMDKKVMKDSNIELFGVFLQRQFIIHSEYPFLPYLG